jgi:hypothetical protein
MTNLDEVDVGLIASGGRTGTTFLGEFLSEMIPRAHSAHEPDVWPGLNREALRRIRTFGFRHMVVDRLLGRSGFRNLSLKHLRGELTIDEAAREIRRQRRKYYSSAHPLVIESNYQSFGLLRPFRRAFPDSRIVTVVRDPRTWVASYLDYGTRRGGRDRVLAWGRSRLHPRLIDDEEYADGWSSMSRFERLCWDWRSIYGRLVRAANADPMNRMFRYEDLFLGPGREEVFGELLKFITDFGDRSYEYSLVSDSLDERVNVRPARTASGGDDAGTMRDPAAMQEICGELMDELGYGPD